MDSIPLQASVEQIERVLRERLHWPSYEYLQDHHFASHVATQLHSIEEVLAFADKLDAECHHGCAKAHVIRQYFNGRYGEFWRQGDRFRSVLAHCRRIHCWAHQAGSYHIERTS